MSLLGRVSQSSLRVARLPRSSVARVRFVHAEHGVHNNFPFSYANKRSFAVKYAALASTAFSVPFIAVIYQLDIFKPVSSSALCMCDPLRYFTHDSICCGSSMITHISNARGGTLISSARPTVTAIYPAVCPNEHDLLMPIGSHRSVLGQYSVIMFPPAHMHASSFARRRDVHFPLTWTACPALMHHIAQPLPSFSV
ncbi:hypothetical protein A0H81_07285 [Grifola frondosa]|uniref:Uncharacterized protein n=1 Tax=Grifola frondosa TaxID=5627 RepID=A0A1C7M890_GRIFR|nr:hypothetical protein A0H81_07285 [Grifola frondosa]